MMDSKEHQCENSIISISQELLKLSILQAFDEALRMGINLDSIVLKMNKKMPGLSNPITRRKLKGWVGLEKQNHPMPAGFLPAYCIAVESNKPIRIMANVVGKDILTARQSECNEVADILNKIRELQKEVAEKSDALEKKYGYRIKETTPET